MSESPEEISGPRRVIGTPSPAPKSVDVAEKPDTPGFSAEPSMVDHAKNAERVVAALFILAFLAGCGFIAAYVGLEVGVASIPKGANTVVAAFRSNLALGSCLSIALLRLGIGSRLFGGHPSPNM